MGGKTYRGDRTIDGCMVTVDGAPLPEALETRAFTTDGFEWSYEGDGPRQLAFAMLLDHFGDSAAASRDCEAFMAGVVANFNNEWEMTSADVERALANLHAAA